MLKSLAVILLGCLTVCCGNNSLKDAIEDAVVTDWIKLTQHKGDQVIYNSCDMGNLILSLAQNNDQTNLKLHGEQEDVDFKILSITRVNDTAIIEATQLNSEFKQSFKFNWVDKSKGIARWRTQFETGHKSDLKFVNKANKNKFIIVDQPCRECWGDECDE